MTPDLYTLTEYLSTTEELEQVPRPGPSDPPERRPQHRWRVWIFSGVLGVGVGAAVASAVLLIFLVPAGRGVAPLGVGLVAVGLVVGLSWFNARQGHRWLDPTLALGVAAAVVAGVVAVPPEPAAHLGGRFVVATLAGVLAYLTLTLVRQQRAITIEARVHNQAVARLVADPHQAVTAHLTLSPRPHDAASYVNTGEVRYTDVSGVERVVPLMTTTVLVFPLSTEQITSDASPCPVWHLPDHSVVLTRILIG